MSILLEYIASPTAVVGLGAMTLVLLGTTYYLSTSGGDNENGNKRRKGGAIKANGEAERPKLDRTVSAANAIISTRLAPLFPCTVSLHSFPHTLC